MKNIQSDLSLRKIFLFWIPLASTWLMMSLEGPFLAALIARLPEPKFNLAAYGVAYSFALIIEAPVIMMMSASTALVKNFQSFQKLRNFTFSLSIFITLLMLIFIIPDIFYFVTIDLIKLPPEISRITHIATMILVPWPGSIGYRRFYQGILIRNGMTRKVAYGTVIRLLTMSLMATLLFTFTDIEGAVVGASALSAAVIMEAAASRIMVNNLIRNIKTVSDEFVLSYKEIFSFYYPLALTSIIGLGVQPVVTFFIGQSRMAIESLAVLPVVTSFVFIFRAMGLSYQEVVIALSGENRQNIRTIKNFAAIMAMILVLILSTVSFSPLALLWLKDVSALSTSLAGFARTPLMIMSVFPALTVLISFQRGVLVNANRTKPITMATVIEFSFIIITMLVSIKYLSLVGAVAATISFVAGRLMANLYFHYSIAGLTKLK